MIESDMSLSWSSSVIYPSLWMPILVVVSTATSLVSLIIARNSISSACTVLQYLSIHCVCMYVCMCVYAGVHVCAHVCVCVCVAIYMSIASYVAYIWPEYIACTYIATYVAIHYT